MSDTPECPPGAHTHPVLPKLLLFTGTMVALDDVPVALCPSDVVAARIADLINQHGLIEVPDTIPLKPGGTS